MAFWLPFGFDRASDPNNPNLPSQPLGSAAGLRAVGTPQPAGDLIVAGDNNGTNVQENPDSPEIERAEQATFQHKFKTTWANACALIVGLGRGTFLQDSGHYITTSGTGTIWRVLSSKIQAMRGGYAELSVVAESISFDSPPDDYQMIPVELGIDIIKHPRYFYALYPSGSDFTDLVGVAGNQATRAQVKQAIIRAIQTYRDSPYFPQAGQVTLNGIVQNSIVNYFIQSLIPTILPPSSNESQINVSGDAGCLLAIAAAAEIIQKLWNGLDSPYMPGFQVTLTQYFFAPVFENPGGYIESPVGIVPDYFLSPAQDGSNTIFDQMAAINPQCFSLDGTATGTVNISWLRKADEVVYERTWFKITSTWIGSPIGHWDAQIFQNGPRPSLPADYLPLV